MSRFAVDHGPQDEKGLSVLSGLTAKLFCGLVEYAIEKGVREIWTAYDIRIERIVRRVGAKPLWMSKRHRVDSTIAVAGRFETTPRVLEHLRRVNDLPDPVLVPAAAVDLLDAA